MDAFVCRFAPSPNGRLHLGHALSALLNADAARAAGGLFLLRIEDIDTVRCRPEYEQGMLDDLAWLGILPDAPPRRQSEHFAQYAAALAQLEMRGLVYPCFESRADIARAVAQAEEAIGHPAARDPDGAPLYPFSRRARSDAERTRRRAAGEPFVLRLDMTAALAETGAELYWQELAQLPPEAASCTRLLADPATWGDVVLARRDTPTSYHLSVVMDDALQGITHVIRGDDLKAATSVHVLLQRLLGLPTPIYHHHHLMLDEAGHKLSKSRDSTSLAALRAQGMMPEEVRRRLGLATVGLESKCPSGAIWGEEDAGSRKK